MIYTSYFGKLRELRNNGVEPIAISRSVPQNFDGERIIELAPTWAMMNMSDEDYEKSYKRLLQRVDKYALIESFEGRNVALLCWEKDVNQCHRKLVAEWLNEAGCQVKEFSDGYEQLSLFE